MKYAYVIERKSSPYYYISYWCPRAMRRKQEATSIRVDSGQPGRRKANELAVKKSKDAAEAKADKGVDRWERWVEPFLDQRYGGSDREKTLTRMKGAWKQWQVFLAEREVRVPRALRHVDVMDFITWRSSQVKPASKKRVSKNTALVDVKCMSIILREAVKREFCTLVVTERLGIRKDPPREKREMSDLEIAKIREELKARPEWMRVSFEIAIHQGCRLSETSLLLSDVDIERSRITFRGKGRKVFATRLHDGLQPMIRELRSRGLTKTCELPRMAAKEWHFFFRGIGLPHLCFHSTRVTVITRLARAGVALLQAMAYVGHASSEIHRIYAKLNAGDTGPAVDALSSLSAKPTPAKPAAPTTREITQPPTSITALASVLAGAGVDLSAISVAELVTIVAQGQRAPETVSATPSSGGSVASADGARKP